MHIDQERMKRRLEAKRDELFGLHQGLEEAMLDTRETSVEFEENAQKQARGEVLDRLDNREKSLLENVDKALRKLEAGGYGLCESCGIKIQEPRLEALPWTPLCVDCARAVQEGRQPRPESDRPSLVPEEFAGMGAQELERAVRERLESLGGVDASQITVERDGDTLRVSGFLPNRRMLQTLRTRLMDDMGFGRISYEVRVQRPAMPEREAGSQREPVGKSREEELLQGEDMNEDIYDSLIWGDDVVPPDTPASDKR
jgi:RNA polymerase-binding protein DksA